ALVEDRRDPPAASGLALLGEHLADQFGQLASSRSGGSLGGRLASPLVERRAGHAKLLTHPDDRVVGLLRFDQRRLLAQSCVRAKKAAAFFRNSFSIRNLRISSSISATRARSTGL